jgi:hypothetical protein
MPASSRPTLPVRAAAAGPGGSTAGTTGACQTRRSAGRGLQLRGIIRGSLTFARPPVTCGTRMEQVPLGLTTWARTPQLPAAHVRLGTGSRTQTRIYTCVTNEPPSVHSLTTCDLASHAHPRNMSLTPVSGAFLGSEVPGQSRGDNCCLGASTSSSGCRQEGSHRHAARDCRAPARVRPSSLTSP